MRAVYYPPNVYTAGPDSNPVSETFSYLAPVAAVATGVAALQGPVTGGVALTLNGSLVVGGVAVFDVQRQVIVFSTGNDNAITFRVTGTNANGNVISESIAGGNGSSVATSSSFKTVTSIVPSATTANTVSSGTNGVANSPPVIVPVSQPSTGVTLSVKVTGTVNWSVQQTFDNPFVPNPDTQCTWVAVVAGLTGQTGAAQAATTQSAEAYRLLINSNTPPGGAQITVLSTTSALAL